MGAGPPSRAGPAGRHRGGDPLGLPGQLQPAAAAHSRSVRPPHRRGRFPSGLAPADGGRRRERPARDSVARTAIRRARRAGGRLLHLVAGRGRARLPGLDDVRGGAGPAQAARAGKAMGAPGHFARLRPWPEAADDQAWSALRDGHDRAPGRLRCARQHHSRGAGGRRGRILDHRPQMVRVRADVRRLSGPGPGPRRPFVLCHAARAAGRSPQRLSHPAAERQARQPLQRIERGGVRARIGGDGRGGGERRADDHRHGQPHAP